VYSQKLSAARHTPRVRSQSTCAVDGEAAGVTESVDAQPTAASIETASNDDAIQRDRLIRSVSRFAALRAFFFVAMTTHGLQR